MSDLISRSALIEKLEEKMFDSELMCPVIKLTDLIELIDKQPTAYDVEKVAAELEKEKCTRVTYKDKYGQGWNNGTANAIAIVRKGGIK